MARAANDAMQAIYEGDWSRAEQLAREALQTDPDDADYLLPLAIALQMQRRWEEALEVIEGALEQVNRNRPMGRALQAMKERACFELRMFPPKLTGWVWNYSAEAIRIHMPSGMHSGENDPVPATPVTTEEVGRLQELRDGALRGYVDCVLSAVAPGDSRRALVNISLDVLNFHEDDRTEFLSEDDLWVYFRLFEILSVDEGLSYLHQFIDDQHDRYYEYWNELFEPVEDFARIIYEVFTTVDLGLSGVPESESAAHHHDHSDKKSTKAVIGVRDGSEGICISLSFVRHASLGSGPLAFLEGPVANLIKQARGDSDDDPISIGLEDAEGELRVLVETLRPLLELWRSDPARAYFRVLETFGADERPFDQASAPADAEEDREDARDLTMRGFDLVEHGQWEAALSYFNRAIEIDPEAGGAWYGRGVALILLDRDEEGRTSLDRALEIYPGLADAWADKGEALFNAGLFEEAEECNARALQIAPDHAESLRQADLLRAVRGEHPEGREILQKYADQLCENAAECLGCRHFAAGSDYAARALKLVPDHLAALFMHGILLKIQDDDEGALTQYDQIITLDPDNARGHSDRGQILVKLRRYEEAIEAFWKAASLGDEHARQALERLRERNS